MMVLWSVGDQELLAEYRKCHVFLYISCHHEGLPGLRLIGHQLEDTLLPETH